MMILPTKEMEVLLVKLDKEKDNTVKLEIMEELSKLSEEQMKEYENCPFAPFND